jgi:putative Mg2+ transporter-C (MgtC) family protein
LLDWTEIILRLGAATVAGGLIGLNRDLQGKPIGVRTLGLVGLATAMIVVLAVPAADPTRISDAVSRVIQGILTGIGFLGAGVIVHREKLSRVHGLTSAACTWLTACVGMVCGAGHWRIVTVALAITFVVLLAGGAVERWLHRTLGGRETARDKSGLAEAPQPDRPSDGAK